jgi:hypothetical protein
VPSATLVGHSFFAEQIPFHAGAVGAVIGDELGKVANHSRSYSEASEERAADWCRSLDSACCRGLAQKVGDRVDEALGQDKTQGQGLRRKPGDKVEKAVDELKK